MTILRLPEQTCPYQDWYKFRVCTIKTCKNFNTVTPTHCLGIDRVVPVGNKLMSDSELNLYKFRNGVSTRLVAMKRKSAIDRVKAVLVLDKYLEYITHHRKGGDLAYNTELIEHLELNFPLKLNRLHFQNWMWPHLVDKKLWNVFLIHRSGECVEYSIAKLLRITEAQLETLRSQIHQEI